MSTIQYDRQRCGAMSTRNLAYPSPAPALPGQPRAATAAVQKIRCHKEPQGAIFWGTKNRFSVVPVALIISEAPSREKRARHMELSKEGDKTCQ